MLKHLLAHQMIMACVRTIAGSALACNVGTRYKCVQQGLMGLQTGQPSLVVAAAGVTASCSEGSRRLKSSTGQVQLDKEDVTQQLSPTMNRRRRNQGCQHQALQQQQLQPLESSSQQQQQHQLSTEQPLEDDAQLNGTRGPQPLSDENVASQLSSSTHQQTNRDASSTLQNINPSSSAKHQAASSAHSATRPSHVAATYGVGVQEHASSYHINDKELANDEGDHCDDTASSEDEADYMYRNSDEVQAAISRITRFLDFRERCASEVLTKLHSLGYGRELSQQVLMTLQQAELQSDQRFAECYVRGLWRSKAQSPSRLAYELRLRGVAGEHIEAALASVFGDAKQLPAREPGNEAEEEAWDHLVDVCKRKVEFTQNEPAQKRRAKLAGWLQRRGHSMSTVFRIFDAVGI